MGRADAHTATGQLSPASSGALEGWKGTGSSGSKERRNPIVVRVVVGFRKHLPHGWREENRGERNGSL